MNRTTRYAVALIVAAGITGGVALASQPLGLLAGIFVTYFLAIAIALRYPSLIWGRKRWNTYASGVFAGGTTFGVLSLSQGLGVEFHLSAGILGFGLTMFGAATGIWMTDTTES